MIQRARGGRSFDKSETLEYEDRISLLLFAPRLPASMSGALLFFHLPFPSDKRACPGEGARLAALISSKSRRTALFPIR
jgi:hypothetical protein